MMFHSVLFYQIQDLRHDYGVYIKHVLMRREMLSGLHMAWINSGRVAATNNFLALHHDADYIFSDHLGFI